MNLTQHTKYKSHSLISVLSFQFCVWILFSRIHRKMFMCPKTVIISIPENDVSDDRCTVAEQTFKDLKKSTVK